MKWSLGEVQKHDFDIESLKVFQIIHVCESQLVNSWRYSTITIAVELNCIPLIQAANLAARAVIQRFGQLVAHEKKKKVDSREEIQVILISV